MLIILFLCLAAIDNPTHNTTFASNATKVGLTLSRGVQSNQAKVAKKLKGSEESKKVNAPKVIDTMKRLTANLDRPSNERYKFESPFRPKIVDQQGTFPPLTSLILRMHN